MIEKAIEAKREQHRAHIAAQKEQLDAMLAALREQIIAWVTAQMATHLAEQLAAKDAAYEARFRVLKGLR